MRITTKFTKILRSNFGEHRVLSLMTKALILTSKRGIGSLVL